MAALDNAYAYKALEDYRPRIYFDNTDSSPQGKLRFNRVQTESSGVK